MSGPRGWWFHVAKTKSPPFLSAGFRSYDCFQLALIGLRRHVDRVMMMVAAMGQRDHEQLMLAGAGRGVNQKSMTHTCLRADSVCVAADSATNQNVLNRLDQIGRRIAQKKIRSRNLRRMKAHLENWQPGEVLVDGLGDFTFFRPAKTMADQRKINLHCLAQLHHFFQLERGKNSMAFLLEQQLAGGFQDFG